MMVFQEMFQQRHIVLLVLCAEEEAKREEETVLNVPPNIVVQYMARPTLSGTTTEQLSLKCSLSPSSSSALPGGSITCMRKRCVSKVSLSSCYCGGRYIMWLHDDEGKNDPPTLRLSQIYKFRKPALLSLFGWCCWALSRG